MNQLTLPLPPEAPAVLTHGQARLVHVVKHLVDHPITDRVADSGEIYFTVLAASNSRSALQLHMDGDSTAYSLHYHALGQVCSRVRINRGYVAGLLDENQLWAHELLVENFNTLFLRRTTDKKFLVRSVGGQVRGFLTNAYKCLDSARLIDEFVRYAKQVQAEPYDAFITDLRVAVQANLSGKWTIAGSDVRVGVMMRNSEVGAGHAEVHFCLSTHGRSLVSSRGVKKPHRGRRLTRDQAANERIKSEDSAKIAEAMRTHVLTHMEASNIQAVMAEVELSATTEIDIEKIGLILEGVALSEAEVTAAVAAFKEDRADLPPGHTLYRLANTVALLAEKEEDGERKLELMDAAGDLIMKE